MAQLPVKKKRSRLAWIQASPYLRSVLFLIAVGVVLFFLLMMNQSTIARKAFENAKMESRTRIMAKENAQLSEQLYKSGDLSAIRNAAEGLDMHTPMEGQIRRLRIARQDYLTVGGKESGEALSFDWKRALNNVAGYLRTTAEEAPQQEVTEEDWQKWEVEHGR